MLDKHGVAVPHCGARLLARTLSHGPAWVVVLDSIRAYVPILAEALRALLYDRPCACVAAARAATNRSMASSVLAFLQHDGGSNFSVALQTILRGFIIDYLLTCTRIVHDVDDVLCI